MQLAFHWYGFLVGLGVVVAVMLFEWLMKKESLTFSLNALALWLFIPGIIGARLYHLITDWQLYQEKPFAEMLAIWNGGIGVIGALLGGAVGLYFFLLTQKQWGKRWVILDLFALCIPFAQAVGRFGNFFNQELYGVSTTLPWGIAIDARHLLPGLDVTARYHPLFLYESLLMVSLGTVLWLLYTKRWQNVGSGVYIGVYLAYYSMVRFLLEFLRVESSRVSLTFVEWLTVAQWMMAVLFLLGVSVLFVRIQKKEKAI